MNARNGKIARLPRFIRNQLNERLECSEESPQLLAWLNALDEVKEVLQEHFAGVPINKQNLSEWRQGGFQEWLLRRDLCDEARELAQSAEDMIDSADVVLADAAATVLAVRFGSMLTNWDGEADEKFEAKSRALNRLCRSAVQLQRGMHQANRQCLEVDRLKKERAKAEEDAEKQRRVQPWFDALTEPVMAKTFGGGTAGRKIAEYILAIQRGMFHAELNILPTDTYKNEEPAVKEAKPVKPARKVQTRKRAGKTKPDAASKRLQESEIESEKEGQSSQDQSESVKVNQTDVALNEDEPAIAITALAGKSVKEEANRADKLDDVAAPVPFYKT